MASSKQPRTVFPLNLNVGIMGHVDSGKTSLVKALSTTLSTAALDKNPQSQQRGITIDLGFSALTVPMPDHLKESVNSREFKMDELQFTLVDCPGHASLIRTIMGGAQIIDMMMLVVDCVKGIQTQTAECLVIGEITCETLIVVLNKIDSIPTAERDERLAKQKKRIKSQLLWTKFKDCAMVCVAAAVGGEKAAANASHAESWGLDELIDALRAASKIPERDDHGPFFFAIDHCFPIKGQGTVVTGTCLRGSVGVNSIVELPALGLEKKVKSIQMFKKPVKRIGCGDRAGVCLAQLDASLVERGILAAPGSVPVLEDVIALVHKVRFFRGTCATDAKFHCTVGHFTVLATAIFFGRAGHQDFDANIEYPFRADLGDDDDGPSLCLLRFESRLRCQFDALVVGSRLDGPETSQCRVAFHGRLLDKGDVSKLKIYKIKQKEGRVARVEDKKHLVGKELFNKETNMQQFVGLKLQTAAGDIGTIASAFGKSGKFKVNFDQPLSHKVKTNSKLILRFKRYLFSTRKDMHQDEACFFDAPPQDDADELLPDDNAFHTSGSQPVLPRAAGGGAAPMAASASAPSSKRLHPKLAEALPQPVPICAATERAPTPICSPPKEDRRGKVERLKGVPAANGTYELIIAEGFFRAEDDQRPLIDSPVSCANGDQGKFAGPFGKAGKSKVSFAPKGTTAQVGDALTLHIATTPPIIT